MASDLFDESNYRIHTISSRSELQAYFMDRLPDVSYSPEVKEYVSALMADFASAKGSNLLSVLLSDELESPRIDAFSSRGDIVSLKDMGDVFLWVCGFFPEHVLDKRRNKIRFSLTLNDYMGYGSLAYSHAASILSDGGIPFRELSQRFPWVAQSIFNMRERMNPTLRYLIHQETMKQIEETLNEGNPMFRPEDSISDVEN